MAGAEAQVVVTSKWKVLPATAAADPVLVMAKAAVVVVVPAPADDDDEVDDVEVGTDGRDVVVRLGVEWVLWSALGVEVLHEAASTAKTVTATNAAFRVHGEDRPVPGSAVPLRWSRPTERRCAIVSSGPCEVHGVPGAPEPALLGDFEPASGRQGLEIDLAVGMDVDTPGAVAHLAQLEAETRGWERPHDVGRGAAHTPSRSAGSST